MDKQRRSGRNRKKVKYSKFSDSSDDDFEEKNALLTKKQKGEKSDTSPKSNKKKPEKTEAKNTAHDIPSRSSGSEKPALPKELKVTLQSYHEDRGSKSESECNVSNEEDDKVDLVQEKKENGFNTKLSNIEEKQEGKSKVDTEGDVGDNISCEEDENTDDREDWKESSDESDDGRTKANRKPQAKMKKEKGASITHSKSSAREEKKQRSQAHPTTKSKIINYCAKQPLNLPTVKLRLGLSRKASIKPLHSTVKVQQ